MRLNRQHAERWLEQVSNVVKSNFEGDHTEFDDVSANEYSLLLNGHASCVYTNMQLVLSKRHDIAQMLGSALFGKCVAV